MSKLSGNTKSYTIVQASKHQKTVICVRETSFMAEYVNAVARCAQGFGGETWGKETIGETKTQMGW